MTALLTLAWRLVNNPLSRMLLDLSAFWGQALEETWLWAPVGVPAVDELYCPACGERVIPVRGA